MEPPGPDAARDDLDLARAAAAGDTAAFAQVYRTALPGVTRTARWLLGTSDVDDAVQEAFIRVWDRVGQFRGEASLQTWVVRVAVSVILRHRQREGRWARNAARHLAEMPEVPSTTTSPLDRLALEAAIGSLPPGAREVFVLTQVEGYSHAEAAKTLGTTEATSRSQLRRARVLLRNRLGHGGEER